MYFRKKKRITFVVAARTQYHLIMLFMEIQYINTGTEFLKVLVQANLCL